MHGGMTPTGIALPQTTSGRHSKYLPARMLSRYQEALSDSDLLALRDEISLIDVRLTDVLSRVDTGESGRIWSALQKAWKDFRRAKPADKMAAELAVSDLISEGVSDADAWAEVREIIDQRARLVANERQRLVQLQQMVTVEQAMTLLAAVADTVRRHVVDRNALAAISADLGRLVAHETVQGTIAESVAG